MLKIKYLWLHINKESLKSPVTTEWIIHSLESWMVYIYILKKEVKQVHNFIKEITTKMTKISNLK